MTTPIVRYRFAASVPMAEVRATLQLALVAAESLHGEERVRIETRTRIDTARCECVIDTSAEVGRTLAVIFGGYVRREFGDDAVTMLRHADTSDSLVGSTA